ncbi:hypothetical protein QBD01_001381 [Ochrobactrum sp. 19YEA23]|nr:hypothetical protein [Ochrobactrum sp. 19YEA23]
MHVESRLHTADLTERLYQTPKVIILRGEADVKERW